MGGSSADIEALRVDGNDLGNPTPGMLPAIRETPLIPAEDKKTNIAGWIITLIPRVGIIRPF